MYLLMHSKKTDEFKSGEKINGFTPVQRFFLSWHRYGEVTKEMNLSSYN